LSAFLDHTFAFGQLLLDEVAEDTTVFIVIVLTNSVQFLPYVYGNSGRFDDMVFTQFQH
jgi:hypothetical protein